MYFEEIDGERQLDFVRKFDYIREAGTEGERKAAASIQEELRSFGLESRLEEFPLKPLRSRKPAFLSRNPLRKNTLSPVTAKRQYPGERRGGSLPLCGERRRYQPWLCHRKDRDGKRSGPQRFIRETGQSRSRRLLKHQRHPHRRGRGPETRALLSSFHERDTNPGQSASITETPLTS